MAKRKPARGTVWQGGRYLGEVLAIDATIGRSEMDLTGAQAWRDQPRTRSGVFVVKHAGNLFRTLSEYIKKETTMPQVHAPTNPYRNCAEAGERAAGDYYGPRGIAPRQTDDPLYGGPGLSGQDLDRMVRQHFRDGHAAAERAGVERLAELRATLPDVFDEGYAAGRLERARGIADDFRTRLIVIGVALRDVEEAPKSKREQMLPDLRTALDEAMEFANAMVALQPAAAARALATDEHVEHG